MAQRLRAPSVKANERDASQGMKWIRSKARGFNRVRGYEALVLPRKHERAAGCERIAMLE